MSRFGWAISKISEELDIVLVAFRDLPLGHHRRTSCFIIHRRSSRATCVSDIGALVRVPLSKVEKQWYAFHFSLCLAFCIAPLANCVDLVDRGVVFSRRAGWRRKKFLEAGSC